MKSKNKDFIKLLEDLCYIYGDTIRKNIDSRLEVLIQNNMIKMNLYKDNSVVDQFGLTFNQKEKDSYMYISIVLMKVLFGSDIIYSKDNVFYNDIGDSNLMIIVDDEDLFNRMFSMVAIRREIDFYDKIDNGRKIRNKINRNRTVSYLDEKIGLTRKLLKARGIK